MEDTSYTKEKIALPRRLKPQASTAVSGVASEREDRRRLFRNVLLLSLTIVILMAFIFSMRDLSKPISMSVHPEVPREGEPISVAFTIKNFDSHKTTYTYMLYANGVKVFQGTTSIAPYSSKRNGYLYKNPMVLGDQVNFFLEVKSPKDTVTKTISSPAYPPQVWTSFVSFATFSTTMAGTMASSSIASSTTTTTTAITTMTYYSEYFGAKEAINIGVIFSIVLIILLIHIEVTEPFSGLESFTGRVRVRFNRLNIVLFIIFISMVFTQIALIISLVS